MESHAEFLRLVTLDRAFAQALRRDWRSAPLSPADRAMLEYVEAVTRDPRAIGSAEADRLRASGFDDVAIVQITMIAAWFNYINRMADALGVGRDTSDAGHQCAPAPAERLDEIAGLTAS